MAIKNKFCIYCGKMLTDGARCTCMDPPPTVKFCVYCGKKTYNDEVCSCRTSSPSVPSKPHEPSKPTKPTNTEGKKYFHRPNEL